MPQLFDPDRFKAAATRFRNFFDELRETFVEREDTLIQFQLALLSREHVLMTGPPGTAKSQMAAAVLRRIVDERTGEPSVFSRQFTESTVQTDLVGPIDFKTLMDSGRTEHFTDEGILGAVHAFLDEVFDGRDMLLRSTLNLLHERELKQGGATTVGRIESAFMTSNRYIAEILEDARETLLAFLDRIAFVSFVPRGFAEPRNLALVVRRHGGGFGRHQLTCQLSIQDLDVLQSAVERTFLPEPICDGLAQLLRDMDAEQAAAMRADRSFQPTRYLSTRTAVRAAKVVRAGAVHQQIFARPRRNFMVSWDDLQYLRHNLILAGLSRERVARLMDHETDPRERRQLDIMRTEAEIFDRCLAKVVRRPLPDAPPEVDLPELEGLLERARRHGDPKQLVAAAHTLARASESGSVGADGAARLLVETVGVLSEHALSAGLVPDLGKEPQAGGAVAIAEELAGVADDLEQAMGTNRPMARWLRGRMLELVDDALELSSSVAPESVELLLREPSRQALEKRIDACIASAERVFHLRRQLQTGGAWVADEAADEATWQRALDHLEEELALLWDVRFRGATQSLLGAAKSERTREVFAELGPHLHALDRDIERIEALGYSGDHKCQLRKRVVGPRLEPLVSAALQHMNIAKRRALVEEVASMVKELTRTGLGDLIDPERFVAWTAPALVNVERSSGRDAPEVRDLTSYRSARAQEDELSLIQTLVEIALQVVPPESLAPEHPRETTQAVLRIVRDIRPDLQRDIAELDLMRIDRGVRRLQDWWGHLSAARERARDQPEHAVSLMESAVQSGFLRVMRSPEPLQLAREAKNLSEVFPEQSGRTNALRKRLRQLDEDCTRLLVELLQDHSQRAWNQALAEPATGRGEA